MVKENELNDQKQELARSIKLSKTDEAIAHHVRVELPKIQKEMIVNKIPAPMILDHAGN